MMKVEHYRTVAGDYITVKSNQHWPGLLVSVLGGNAHIPSRSSFTCDAIEVKTEDLCGVPQFRLRAYRDGRAIFLSGYLLDGGEPQDRMSWKPRQEVTA